MTYLAKATSVRSDPSTQATGADRRSERPGAALYWDEQSADDQLRTTLRRCDAAWTRPGVFSGESAHQRKVDLEEAFHVAFHAKDRLTYESALSEYERYVIEAYLADVTSSTAEEA